MSNVSKGHAGVANGATDPCTTRRGTFLAARPRNLIYPWYFLKIFKSRMSLSRPLEALFTIRSGVLKSSTDTEDKGAPNACKAVHTCFALSSVGSTHKSISPVARGQPLRTHRR